MDLCGENQSFDIAGLSPSLSARTRVVISSAGSICRLMNRLEPSEQRISMISWVVVLAALIGWNALAGEAVRSNRDETSRAVVLSAGCEDGQVVGRQVDPPVFLAMPVGDGWVVDVLWAFVGIECGPEGPVFDFPRGVGCGRGPPMGDC
jgi:hypothetical protein